MPGEPRIEEDQATIRVLIADDEPLLREAIADLIRSQAGLELAGAAGDADAAIARARETQPHVALIDVKMPGGGEDAVRGIMRCSPATHVITLSAYDDGPTAVKMLLAGAVGYLVKGVATSEIVEAIRRAARGQSSISAVMTRSVVEELVRSEGELRAVELALRISEKNLRAQRPASPRAARGVDPPRPTIDAPPQGEVVTGARVPGSLGREGEEATAGTRPADYAGVPAHVGSRQGRTRRDAAVPKRDRAERGTEFPSRVAGAGQSLGVIANDERRLLAAFVRDIGELGARRLEVQAGQDAATRRELLVRLVASGEDERRRIAADIHDDSIQAITAAGMRLQMLRATVNEPHQVELIGEIESTIGISITRLRHLLFELLPPLLGPDGLTAALHLALHEAGKDTRTRFQLEDELNSQPSAETGLILYRITQEALANVRKHAAASNATIRLDEIDGGYRVRVTDDGVGFASGQVRSAPGHLGLTGMHERAELAGGWLRIEGEPGTGTVLECWIPSPAA